MGLPQIDITFINKAQDAIRRSGRGVVAVILKDDTEGGKPVTVYPSIADVDFSHFTQRNYEYLKLLYEGGPYKVIVVKVPADTGDLAPYLKKLRDLKWNYLTVPGLTDNEKTLVSAWIKEEREKDHKTFKAVLPNCTADHEGVINFTTDNIESTLGGSAFSAAEYCTRIAGVLAGLSLARSSTYYVLSDITGADVPDDPDERVDKGQLVIVFDGEKYKIGRGVNSLTTFTAEHGKDFSKIKIVEGVDLYRDDIRSTFEDVYVGKVVNSYDHKQAFVAAVQAYQRGLEGDVLDGSYDNTAAVDIGQQRLYLESRGIDTSSMDDVAVAQYNTGSRVFISSNVKFVDAMEDLHLVCNM